MPRGQGVYKVSGTGAIWLLENDEWHWAPTQDSFFAWGYSWADIQAIDLATFCQYPVGQRLTEDGTNFTGVRGYIPSGDRAALDCSKVAPPEPPPPEPTPPPPEPTPPPAPPPTEEGIRWAYNPPILEGVSGAGAWPRTVSKMTSILTGLVNQGYNVASVNWRPPREWGQQQYLDVVHAAEQAGIQLMPWMGWSASSINQVIGWIGESPSIWGWYSHDEPLAGGGTIEGQQNVYNALKQYDPYARPVVTTFTNARSEDWARAWAPHTFDIAAFDLYPYAMSPEDPEYYLSYWANRLSVYFIDAGKQVIPMMQGYTHPGTPSPEIIPQWEWWRASRMPLYPNSYSVFGGEVHSQAAELARLLGWSPALPPTYTCPHCGATFSSQADLDAHVASVHHYVCPHCGATFITQAELDAHIASEHPAPVFTCPHCGATFGSQAELDDHIASVHPPVVFTCPECGDIFDSQAELDAHIASEHPAPVFTCPECGLTFGTQAELDAHIASEHPPLVYTCPECGATFSTEADLDAHIASAHPAPVYECPHCGATFVTQEELDIHIASEHPAPVYECPHCGLILAAQVELEAHVASEHPAAPVFKCIYCGAIFASQADLNAHIATEHPIAAEVVPWYKKWQTYLVLGIGAVIAGVAIKKKVAKR